MVREENNDDSILEHGDLFFFYRPKIDSIEVEDLEDVGRFYMVTSPEQNQKASKNRIHRLFLLGQKHLPEIVEGKSISKERNWALNILTTSNPEDIHKELMPVEYNTETRGKRRTKAATPAGDQLTILFLISIVSSCCPFLSCVDIKG